MIKKSRQKLKNLENKKSFWSENDYKKCFLFNLKSSFCFRDVQIFVFPTSPQFFPVSHWLRGRFKINLKVYDVSICLNKNLITHLFDSLRRKKHLTLKKSTFVWYLENEKTYDIETLPIDRVLCKEHLHGKIVQQLWTESQSKIPS